MHGDAGGASAHLDSQRQLERDLLMRLLGRRRSIYLVLLIVCAALSLRPMPSVSRGIELLFTPTRVIAELVAPLGWARIPTVRAAEARLDEVARGVRGDAADLLALEQASALPADAGLRHGRRLIHGEVLRRSRGDRDRIQVHVASTEGIVPGLPVVTGDAYVGRVARIDEDDLNLVHVDLVTRTGFFVGANVRRRDWRGDPTGEPIAFTVGGLAPQAVGDEEQLHLALHNPTLRGVETGEVLVSEPEDFEPELAALSRGYLLGALQTARLEQGSRIYRIESPLDFASGLYQVIVLAPEGSGPPAQRLELETFVDGNWVGARALTRGDVTATREGRRLSKGASAGVEPGSAVALGAHLVGRIGETGLLSSDLLGLGDPGLRLVVLAQLKGEVAPRPIGELIALGRERDSGALRFRWTCRIDLEPGPDGGPRAAELYTGSGEDGIPRGLYVGSTRLPIGRETHELFVEQDPAVRDLGHVFVWTAAERRERFRAQRDARAEERKLEREEQP